jgi:serine/threonine protein kinase
MDKHLILTEKSQTLTPAEIGERLDDYEILQKIGKGGYGFIAKVKSKRNREIYAMKMIDLTKLKDPKEKELSLNEIKLIQGLNSPHIINYYHNFLDNNKLYIIMDFMNNGDLKGFIEANKEMNKIIPEEEIVELFYQCMAGLYYCHKNNIIHRDIKPANLFMTDTKDIKIGDFGISAQKRKKGEANTLTIGTPQFMAPEMFNNTGYDSKIDVYAMGCTFHAICYFCLPREIVTISDAFGVRGEIRDIPINRFSNVNFYSNDIKNLIYRMIDRNPVTRPSSEQVFNDIKALYNKTHKQNSSIASAYNGLYSFSNLTQFMETQKPILSQYLVQKPISNSFTYFTSNVTNPNQVEVLNSLRDILTYENSVFPDPGQIDPIDIVKFIIQRIHLETNSGTYKGMDIFGDSIQNYLQNLSFVKSCILDFFFGTLQIKKFCNTCRQTTTIFTNYYQLTFDIDQALKIGMGSNNLLTNYFINQNKMLINYPGICNYCKQQAYLQESKTIFSLPYNLVICFKGEKNNYNNQYISYYMTLNLSQLGLTTSPKEYALKAIIKCYLQNDQKFYVSIYLDPKTNQWFLSSGYTKQVIPNPAMHNMGDVVALFYSSA